MQKLSLNLSLWPGPIVPLPESRAFTISKFKIYLYAMGEARVIKKK